MPHTAITSRLIWSALAGCMLLGTLSAQAQMVPKTGHILRSMAARQSGAGLNLDSTSAWPHWEGRVGVVMARPVDPVKDSYVLVQPQGNNGFNLRSAHILSDYHFAGGFRATAGLLRGSLTQSSWTEPDGSGPGLNLSLQYLDGLNLPSAQRGSSLDSRTVPYIGAGYTLNVAQGESASSLKVNADVGVVSSGSNLLNRVLPGDGSSDNNARDLHLEPVVKVSVQYAF